jgi:CRP-like cAMP-binding protein
MDTQGSPSPSTFAPFEGLSDLVRRRLLAGAEALTLRTGKALYYQGDRASSVYLLLQGRIRTVMYRSDETTLDLGSRGPGDWLGLAETVLSGPRLTDAVAIQPCRLLGWGRVAFGRLRDAPETREWLVAELARGQYALHARIEVVHPGQRLARWLAQRAEGSRLVVEMTQDELAAAVGTTRETVNRHLARLQAEGLVRVTRGALEILDPETLATWSGT